MRSHIIRINQGRYLPLLLRLLYSIIVASGILWFLDNFDIEIAIPTSIILSGFVPFIWSSFYILEIDLKQNTVFTYLWVAGLKLGGETFPFNPATKISVLKEDFDIELTLNKRISSRNRKFKVYLEFSDGKVLYLISDNYLDTLQKRLKHVLIKSELPIVFH